MSASNSVAECFFTAPWEEVSSKRGDPLGFRAIADRFAELLVPGLSGRIADARWFTILSWCVCVSHRAPWRGRGSEKEEGYGERSSEGRDLGSFFLRTREGARRRYEWLRPLEVLWVARTGWACEWRTEGRYLPGIRAAKRWFHHLSDGSEASNPDITDQRYGMSRDQWVRYRNTGPFGAHRRAMRALRLLADDGWTPTKETYHLADITAGALGDELDDPDRLRHGADADFVKGNADPEVYWRDGWKFWAKNENGDRKQTRAFLPESWEDVRKLPEPESKPLAGVLFGDDEAGRRRRSVAGVLSASNLPSHTDACRAVAERISRESDNALVSLLPDFAEFADSAAALLSHAWELLGAADRRPSIKVSEAASGKSAKEKCEALRAASEKWLKIREQKGARDADAILVDTLANAVRSCADQAACVRAVISHHQTNGGGQKWMRLDGDNVVSLTPPRGQRTSLYQFRLAQICRMAVQCGVINAMPAFVGKDAPAE